MARKSIALATWLKKNHPRLEVLGLHFDIETKRHEVVLGCKVVLPRNVMVSPEDEDAHADGERQHLLLPGVH